jgi:hypothetical protein
VWPRALRFVEDRRELIEPVAHVLSSTENGILSEAALARVLCPIGWKSPRIPSRTWVA